MNRQTLRRILITVTGMAILALLVYVCAPLIRLAKDPDQLRIFIAAHEHTGILIFLGMVTLQVLSAFFPASPFQLAAGFLYGTVRGALLYDLGAVMGSCISFVGARALGRKLTGIFLSDGKTEKLKALLSGRRSLRYSFFFYLIPGLPKDVLPYVIGLTDTPLSAFLIVIFIARFPTILLTSFGGDSLADGKFFMLFMIILSIVLSTTSGKMIYDRLKTQVEDTGDADITLETFPDTDTASSIQPEQEIRACKR